VTRRSAAFAVSLLLLTSAPVLAQTEPTPAPSAVPAAATPRERTSVTHHTIKLGGKNFAYTATAGTLLLRSDIGDATASMFYTAYTLEGGHNRPVTFAYNGGPGSSSMWLHMGSFGPRRVVTTNARTTAPAPYRIADNESTILDKSDIVFIDAVGTGYSTIVGKGKPADFFGVDEDVRAYDQFVRRWVGANSRWNSPKYLFGESYGTTRSANLVNSLQNHGMAFTGVILLSTVLDYATLIAGSGGQVQSDVFFLPTEAAVAWYHNRIPDKPASLPAFLADVRRFAQTEYAPALMRVPAPNQSETAAIAEKLHRYTGLSAAYFVRSGLRLQPGQFEKELMRDQGRTVGRLDGRYLGYDGDQNGESTEYDATDAAITAPYTAAFNTYVHDELKWQTDAIYFPTNYPFVSPNWNFRRGSRAILAPSVVDDLRQAMTKNPLLRVLSANGYYDLATPFFATEYSLAHLGLPEALLSHITYTYYPSGHMVYLIDDQLAAMKRDVDALYDAH